MGAMMDMMRALCAIIHRRVRLAMRVERQRHQQRHIGRYENVWCYVAQGFHIGKKRYEIGEVRTCFYSSFLKGEVDFLDAVAVDGLEIVAHRNDIIASLVPAFSQLEGFLAVGVVAGFVVGYEHYRHRAESVAEAVVVHCRIAAAVAERQDGHLADFLIDLQHFVGLQVFDNQLVGTDNLFLATHSVVDAFLGTLAAGAELDVHTDDAVGFDAKGFDQRATDEAVGARNDVVGETIILPA